MCGAKKKLVITLQITYNENTEDGVIRYCHEIVDKIKILPDFVKKLSLMVKNSNKGKRKSGLTFLLLQTII